MDRLEIGIDGFNLALRHGTGVSTYGFALSRTLRDAGHHVHGLFGLDVGRDPGLSEILFFDLFAREEPAHKTRKQIRAHTRRIMFDAIRPRLTLSAVDVPLSDRVEKGSFSARLPAFDRLSSAAHLFTVAFRHFDLYKRFTRVRMANPPAIMHWTYPVPVRLEGARNIYTLHDLVPLRLPYTTLDAKRSYAEITATCAREGDHVCTVSEASRTDIVQQFGIDPDRITNTYQSSPMPANALALDADEDARMVQGVLGLPPRGYFLYFGAIEPKKNLGRLIEAYLSLLTETPLVIVGSRGWQSEDELRLLSVAGSAGAQRVLRLDYLPRDLLLRVIRSARAVLFPSLYEGFGLPVLEAMQLGTPVLTSNTSSLPEVAGDAAVLVDPYDVAKIAAGMRRLDEDHAWRERLGSLGLKQSRRFSEDAYRVRLEAMYRHVLAQ